MTASLHHLRLLQRGPVIAIAALQRPGGGAESHRMPACPDDRVLIVYMPQRGVEEFAHLAASGWRLCTMDRVDDIVHHLARHSARSFVALLDLRAGCDASMAESLLPALADPHLVWIAVIAPGQMASPVIRRVIRDYCHDYVQLPCDDVLLCTLLGHAHGMAGLQPDGCLAVAQDRGMDGMIGESAAMQTAFRMLRRAATTDAPVLIQGETGTGKELVASAIHRFSSRHGRPFVAINCGAIPESLVQSELFGYERGAFTGAMQRKRGRIELVEGGTLFLDEIGDLPMESQASLLRFLQEGTIVRLGGQDAIAVDARIISATHVDLSTAIDEGRFRADLYHRLCVIELHQPPLRDRGDDIPRIAAHALSFYASEGRHRIKGFSHCALRALHRYAWPGNVRELINRVRQAVVMAEGRQITALDLRLGDGADAVAGTLDSIRGEAERAAIRRALLRNGQRLLSAAAELGISRVTLYRLMVKHGMRDQTVELDLRATQID